MNDDIIKKNVIKLFENSLYTINKLDESILNFYYSRYKYVNNELIEHNINKPIKCFKKKHEEWLKKGKELEKEKNEVLNKLNEFINIKWYKYFFKY